MPSKNPANRRRSTSDPFARALRPPRDEAPADRDRRIHEELEAKKVSDDIDAQLKLEKAALRRKHEVKILLLGQSESGKSTTLKQFQLLHTPAAFYAERIAWRCVIYLNLIRSIRRILEALLPPDSSSSSFPVDYPYHYDESDTGSSESGRPYVALSEKTIKRFEMYAKRLAPLFDLEARLIRQLSFPDDDVEPKHIERHTSVRHAYEPPKTGASQSLRRAHSAAPSSLSPAASKELVLRTGTDWKKPFSLGGQITVRAPKSAHTGEIQGWWEDPDDPVHVLNACARGDFGMIALWRDKEVRSTLVRRRIRMHESSGFYLDDIERITATVYIPKDDDVLKARLKTLGVVEHSFTIKNMDKGVEWKIYDVGGARNQRQAWAPYFEDVNAIIFLAPISAFDQVLAEDPTVNRLEDSLLLWKSLVTNKLLENVNIILFLNKSDLLKVKLEAGVLLNQHMISYGKRANDYETVSKYFCNKFGTLHRMFTPNKERELYIHLTSVTDTRTTSNIISNVGDILLTKNLKGSRLI